LITIPIFSKSLSMKPLIATRIKAPKSNIQAPEKFQGPSSKPAGPEAGAPMKNWQVSSDCLSLSQISSHQLICRRQNLFHVPNRGLVPSSGFCTALYRLLQVISGYYRLFRTPPTRVEARVMAGWSAVRAGPEAGAPLLIKNRKSQIKN
jgi:hypothetical protein